MTECKLPPFRINYNYFKTLAKLFILSEPQAPNQPKLNDCGFYKYDLKGNRLNLLFYFNILIVCILCNYEFVHTVPAEARGGIRHPAIVSGSYEPPDLGVRNRASFLRKRRTQS